jgi:hypothetical protein
MRFPIETSQLWFVVAAAGEPLKQFEEGEPGELSSLLTRNDSQVLWRVPLVALGDAAGDVLVVTLLGDPQLAEGERVTVKDLTAQTWKLDGGTGVTLCAGAVTSNVTRIASKGG